MKNTYFTMLSIVIMLVAVGTVPAEAFMLGQTVKMEHFYPDFSTVEDTSTVIVGPGVEFDYGAFQIDIGANYIQWDFMQTYAFRTARADAFQFTDLNRYNPRFCRTHNRRNEIWSNHANTQ